MPRQSPISALFLCVVLAGCGAVQTAVDLPAAAVRTVTPGKGDGKVASPDLQLTLVRVSDAFLYRMADDMGKLRRADGTVDRGEILRWKIRFGTELVAATSGPNPAGNMIDLSVFSALVRAIVENKWKPELYGDTASPLLESARMLGRELDRLSTAVLTAEQAKELQAAILTWQKEHPPDQLLVTLSMDLAQQQSTKKEKGGLFDIINLDPLAGLDPALQEAARARAFAERGLYVAQRMPTLFRWQIELLSVDAQEGPAVKSMVANAGQIAASAERITKVTEQLPDKISKEREAILKALNEQEKEVATVLHAGTTLSDSLRETVKATDVLMKRLGVGEAPPPDKKPSEPVKISEVTEAIVRLEATSKQLTELVKSVHGTLDSVDAAKISSQVTPVIQQAQAGGKDVVDYAFGRALMFVAAVVIAALLYRFISVRIKPPAPSK